MLDFCRQRKDAGEPVEVLVVWNTNRLSRADSQETASIVWQFRQAGVYRLLTADKSYDFRRKEDRVMHGMVADFTDNEFLIGLSAAVLRGKKDNAERGFANGLLPYGFDRLLVDDKGEPRDVIRRFQPVAKPAGWHVLPMPIRRDDPDPAKQLERQTVEYIFHVYATEDVSRWFIANALNAKGIPGPGSLPEGYTRRTRKNRTGRRTRNPGPTKWSSGSITSILENPLFAGDFQWGLEAVGRYHRMIVGEVTETPDDVKTGDGKAKRVKNDKPVVIRPDAYASYWPEPYIDRETWNIVQRKLSREKKKQPRCRGSFALNGILRCGRCGHRMNGKTSRNTSSKGVAYAYRKYGCGGARTHGYSFCGNQTIREDLLLPYIIDQVKTICLDPQMMEETRRHLKAQASAKRENNPVKAERLKERIKDAQGDAMRGARNLMKIEDAGVVAQVMREIQTIQARIKDMEKELAGLEQQQTVAAEDVDDIIDEAIAEMTQLATDLEEDDPAKVRAGLKQLVTSVDVFFDAPEKKRAWFRFNRGILKVRLFASFASERESVLTVALGLNYDTSQEASGPFP